MLTEEIELFSFGMDFVDRMDLDCWQNTFCEQGGRKLWWNMFYWQDGLRLWWQNANSLIHSLDKPHLSNYQIHPADKPSFVWNWKASFWEEEINFHPAVGSSSAYGEAELRAPLVCCGREMWTFTTTGLDMAVETTADGRISCFQSAAQPCTVLTLHGCFASPLLFIAA